MSVAALLVALTIAAPAGELVIAERGTTKAVVVVSASAGTHERAAALELVRVIEEMTGAKPALAGDPKTIAEAVASPHPLLVVGSEATRLEPALARDLARVAKKKPFLGADAIAVRRVKNRVLLAGNHDEAHYWAAAWLLGEWGCRWYFPTDFGEHIPRVSRLAVGDLSFAYAPPFEVRRYWLSWNASDLGRADFQRRSFMTYGRVVPNGHALGQYTRDIAPGGDMFKVPIADPATAAHVAAKIEARFAQGTDVSLGMEDGLYQSDSPRDRELTAGIFDKYFQTWSQSDSFLELYNQVARILQKAHPKSRARLGFLAYANMTLPPQRAVTAEPPLVAYLAPIDVDPIHGMDDPRSPPRQELARIMERWAHVMQGRVVIYDYDQGMMVWRDVPAPSISAFRQDVQRYRRAGILGVDTESRGAIATTFLNLFFRARLLWNPDADVPALLSEFYTNFYGPAAAPMAAYWGAIFRAFEGSIVTEHEHFLIPAIYTPELVSELGAHLAEAERAIGSSGARTNDPVLEERMRFTKLGYGVIASYAEMVRAAAERADYRAAVAAGEKALATRLELAGMNPTFTTRVHPSAPAKEDAAAGPAWLPGEVEQMRGLLRLTDGTRGELIAQAPLSWAFRRDPNDTGLARAWASEPFDPKTWEERRTDLYLQAQGVLHPDGQSYTGYAWYRAEIDVPRSSADRAHLMFPGLFNEAWLYVNGALVAHRPQHALWWRNDYRFEWDVDLSGKLKPGKNVVVLRLNVVNHFGGMFRRPFLYQPARAAQPSTSTPRP